MMSTADGTTSLSTLRLPDGFTDVFTSRLVELNGLRLHAVTGGDGPPLLLIGGWPQTWYAWREVMPALAREHAVVAVDSRHGRAGRPAAIPAYAVDVYVEAIVADPRGLRASFAYYRALDETITQNEQRKKTRLTLPVLAVGGARYSGAMAAETMRLAADDVTAVVLDDCGTYVAEEQPAQFAEILEDFLGAEPMAGVSRS